MGERRRRQREDERRMNLAEEEVHQEAMRKLDGVEERLKEIKSCLDARDAQKEPNGNTQA